MSEKELIECSYAINNLKLVPSSVHLPVHLEWEADRSFSKAMERGLNIIGILNSVC